jgi:hypothetical protein
MGCKHELLSLLEKLGSVKRFENSISTKTVSALASMMRIAVAEEQVRTQLPATRGGTGKLVPAHFHLKRRLTRLPEKL